MFEAGRGIGSGEFDYELILRDASGRELPKKPSEVLRIEGLPVGSYHSTLIPPGKTLKEELLVSRLYDLQPGKYTIQLQREDPRIRWVHNGTTLEAKRDGVGPNPVAISNTITITVTP